MTTKDQAIARFIEAVKLDRHDWQDWPTDSREAFVALQQPAPDCRTCEYMWIDVDLEKATSKGSCARPGGAVCINGSLHKPAPKAVLWRTE